MITFLPYSDYKMCAKVLDNRRLGKQRIEVLQILNMLHDKENKFRNQPIVKMWKYHEQSLVLYGSIICYEWMGRDFIDNTASKIWKYRKSDLEPIIIQPSWLGDERLHSNHRARLLDKDPDWYGQFKWTEKPTKEYYWPC